MTPKQRANTRYSYNLRNDPARKAQRERVKMQKREYMQEKRLEEKSKKRVTYTPGHTVVDCGDEPRPKRARQPTLREQVQLLVIKDPSLFFILV